MKKFRVEASRERKRPESSGRLRSRLAIPPFPNSFSSIMIVKNV